jgi:hypothetical protein
VNTIFARAASEWWPGKDGETWLRSAHDEFLESRLLTIEYREMNYIV